MLLGRQVLAQAASSQADLGPPPHRHTSVPLTRSEATDSVALQQTSHYCVQRTLSFYVSIHPNLVCLWHTPSLVSPYLLLITSHSDFHLPMAPEPANHGSFQPGHTSVSLGPSHRNSDFIVLGKTLTLSKGSLGLQGQLYGSPS